ncbi:MAG TPA: tripartite tricarboxylate transporter substrate binding protein [Casimicrobiaceae bacterium]|nr:tripartite tricarboxylate transporter substrate binding protein [Casimicrobiaceae bacterium]
MGGRHWAAILPLIACAALAVLVPGGAAAQGYPAKPIRLIVPFPPGGAVDFYARAVQQPLSETLGQTVVIENRAGASGMVGIDLVAKAPPDGYTLGLGNIASLAINAGIYEKMPYDPARDLTPITHTIDVNYALVVHPSIAAKTVPELVAYARANPGKIAYGSAGSGSLPHLATELFKSTTGTDIVHVPYKGGGPMVTDLLGGTVQMVIADQANLMPHVKAGKLRAIAVASPKRSANHPDLPTIGESLPGFQAVAWNGLVGPPNLPADIVAKLNAAIVKVMAMPEVRDRLAGGGLDIVGDSPDEFARFIRAEIAKWTAIAKQVGAKAE